MKTPTKTPNNERLPYELDPDFRKNPPEDKPFCCRCQKPITGNFKQVRVNWDNWTFIEDPNGTDKMGMDCFRKQVKLSKNE